MEETTTRIVLADDHPRVRAGIRRILERAADMEVVGEAADGEEALALVDSLCPDVLLLDMEMPKLNGSQVAKRLKESHSRVHILALSAYDDQQYILSLLDGGASGYLTKDEAPDALLNAVRGVAQGQQGWVSQRVADKLSTWRGSMVSNRVTLTFREMDLIRLLAEKRTDEEIARQLEVSEAAVQQHIQSLYGKLNARSRTELIVRAAQM